MTKRINCILILAIMLLNSQLLFGQKKTIQRPVHEENRAITKTVLPGPESVFPLSKSRNATATDVVIAEEGFESGIPAQRWRTTYITNKRKYGWGVTSFIAHTGNNSLWCAGWNSSEEPPLDPAKDNYPNDMMTRLRFGPFNLHDASSAELSFYFWKEVADTSDKLSYYYSIDNFHFTGFEDQQLSSNGWVQRTIDLDPVLGNYQVWIMIEFESGPSGTAKGVFLDDILLKKQVDGQPEIELIYDDGYTGKYYTWGSGRRLAMRMSPNGFCKIMALRYFFSLSQPETFHPGIFSWENNAPGNKIWDASHVAIPKDGWNSFDLSSQNILVENDFVVACEFESGTLGVGYQQDNSGRAWDYDGSAWSLFDGTYLIHAIVLPDSPPDPPQVLSPADQAGDLDVSVTLSWQCSDPENDNLYYDILLDTANPPTTVIASKQTQTSIERVLSYDTRYYWQVIAYDELGASTAGPVWSFTTTTESFNDMSTKIFGGTSQNAYRMISVPGMLDNSSNSILEDTFGEYDPKQWRFFQDKNNLREYPLTEDLLPGRAFWLISKETKTIHFGSGKYVTTLSDFILPVVSGWNQVGNPFNKVIDWNNIKEENPDAQIDGPYFYEGGYNELRSSFGPFEGCYVHISNVQSLKIPANTITFKKISGSNPIAAGTEWFLRIRAVCGKAQDGINFVGMSRDAKNDRDALDLLEPPVIGDYVSLYFPHDDWTDGQGKYTSDIRVMESNGGEWTFEVATAGPGKKITLQFENIQSLPKSWELLLFDQETQHVTELRQNSEYVFSSKGEEEPRRFTLIAGTKEFIEEMESELYTTPTTHRMYQNYPNPFNNVTTIRYDISESGPVKLMIYDLQGRLVETLVDEVKEPGRFTVQWDARHCSSGIYFIRFEAGRFRSVQKIALLK